VNSYINVPKFKYEGLPNFTDMVEKRDFAVKFDLTSGYHHISIHKQHCKYLGFKWKFADGIEKYYVFLVLPFGLASACHILCAF